MGFYIASTESFACSTTGQVFGPVFEGIDEAEAFIEWLNVHKESFVGHDVTTDTRVAVYDHYVINDPRSIDGRVNWAELKTAFDRDRQEATA